MLRCCVSLYSKSFHQPTPFVNASLELVKLHLAHQNALDKDPTGSSAEARLLETTFKKELDTYRALYNLSTQMESAKLYSGKVMRAMKHFGLGDDPLVRQMERVSGRQRMQRSGGRNLMFKGVFGTTAPKSTESLAQRSEHLLPTELPHMTPRSEEELASNVVKVSAAHRGHWVLRDPDIALTRKERRYDPW